MGGDLVKAVSRRPGALLDIPHKCHRSHKQHSAENSLAIVSGPKSRIYDD